MIREAIDADVIDADIVNIQNKLLRLTQLMGLSAEANASAKKLLHIKEREVLFAMDKTLPASIQSKNLSAECYNEIAILEYSDRLNAALTHCCDGLRSIISLYKVEVSNSLK